jgi:ABC-type lipoprotein export system ATPase subunit
MPKICTNNDQLHVLKNWIYILKKGEIVSIVGASGPSNSLQILGTLAFSRKKLNFINNEDILTMNDKPIKFKI